VWVLVPVVAAILVLALLMRSRRAGRNATAQQSTAWRRQASSLYSTAAALHDSMNVDLAARRPAAAAGAERWHETEQRMDALTVELHALETQPAAPAERQAVQALLTSLNTLRAAGQTDATLRSQEEPASDAQLTASDTILRQRLSEFGVALQEFRTRL
jgi:hypothetical protein